MTSFSKQTLALTELKNAVLALKAAESHVADAVNFSNTSGDHDAFQEASHLRAVVRTALDGLRDYTDYAARQSKAGNVKSYDLQVESLASSLSSTFKL